MTKENVSWEKNKRAKTEILIICDMNLEPRIWVSNNFLIDIGVSCLIPRTCAMSKYYLWQIMTVTQANNVRVEKEQLK